MRSSAKHPVPAAPPVTLVVFGAMGDLTRRLLVPALLNLMRKKLLPDDFRFVGVSIGAGDDETLRQALGDFHTEAGGEGDITKGAEWTRLAKRISYLQGDFNDDATYAALAERLGAGTRAGRVASGNVAFYLAVPASFFGDIVEKLADHGLMDEKKDAFRRVAVEKPFGADLASARALNARLLARVREEQIYRIDHFLGKETVQNIVATRFANMLIEGMWNSNFIDHVQITVAETVGVGNRGSFYDATGALRDMVPNHLFQLLANVAMEPPASFDVEAVRNEKSKVMKAIRVYTPDEAARHAVRGAYTAGKLGRARIEAYTAAKGVANGSRTETFVALKLQVDTWRWAGVPFYLRTGKVMAARETEVVVTFKQVPFAQFTNTAIRPDALPPNRFVFQIQPDEGLRLDMLIRQPGFGVDTAPATLAFRYADSFDIGHQTGYESLFHDLFVGDQTLFQRADAIESSWSAVQPFLDLWAAGGAPDPYAPGSMGPAAADALLERDGRSWYRSRVASGEAGPGKASHPGKASPPRTAGHPRTASKVTTAKQ